MRKHKTRHDDGIENALLDVTSYGPIDFRWKIAVRAHAGGRNVDELKKKKTHRRCFKDRVVARTLVTGARPVQTYEKRTRARVVRPRPRDSSKTRLSRSRARSEGPVGSFAGRARKRRVGGVVRGPAERARGKPLERRRTCNRRSTANDRTRERGSRRQNGKIIDLREHTVFTEAGDRDLFRLSLPSVLCAAYGKKPSHDTHVFRYDTLYTLNTTVNFLLDRVCVIARVCVGNIIVRLCGVAKIALLKCHGRNVSLACTTLPAAIVCRQTDCVVLIRY